MRLMFVHNGGDLYGASRSLLRLTSRLAKDGHDVVVCLPQSGPLVAALERAGVMVVVEPRIVVIARRGVAGAQGPRQLLANVPLSVRSLVRVIREFRPELVHTNSSVVLSSALAARICRVPHVWHMREFYVDFPKLWPYHRRVMTGLSDRVICVSAAVAQQFGPHSRVRVLHNGFPASEFSEVSNERVAAFRERFGLGSHVLVGIVGRIKFKRKGQETFVRAAALLAKRFPDVRFVVIGSPFPGNEQHEKDLRALVHDLGIDGQVTLTGDVEDVKAAFVALDIVVLASTDPEPFGGVVIEAMALARPVVGTAVGGTVEQISDGDTGLLVPPNDPARMAGAIGRLLEDPGLRGRMGAAGRRRFLSEFEFEPFYAQLTRMYGDLTQQRG